MEVTVLEAMIVKLQSTLKKRNVKTKKWLLENHDDFQDEIYEVKKPLRKVVQQEDKQLLLLLSGRLRNIVDLYEEGEVTEEDRIELGKFLKSFNNDFTLGSTDKERSDKQMQSDALVLKASLKADEDAEFLKHKPKGHVIKTKRDTLVSLDPFLSEIDFQKLGLEYKYIKGYSLLPKQPILFSASIQDLDEIQIEGYRIVSFNKVGKIYYYWYMKDHHYDELISGRSVNAFCTI